MPWGPIISAGLRLMGSFFLNRMDPKRVKFWDLKKLRKAGDEDVKEFNVALGRGDTATIRTLLAGL